MSPVFFLIAWRVCVPYKYLKKVYTLNVSCNQAREISFQNDRSILQTVGGYTRKQEGTKVLKMIINILHYILHPCKELIHSTVQYIHN